MNNQAWMVWPENPAASVLVLAALGMLFLYAARKPMHSLIQSLGRTAMGPLRLGARWLNGAADRMAHRNRAVLLAHGREEIETRIEREFERIGALARSGLTGQR